MDRILLAYAFAAVALLVFGCVGPSGMQSVPVCKNMCGLGETQMPYPDCRCLPANESSSGGGTGGTGAWTGPTPTPAETAAPVFSPTPMEYGDAMLAGGYALPRERQGSLLVFISARNANETPYENVVVHIGEVSAFVAGEGAGWVPVSTSNRTIDVVGIGNKSVPVALNRVWTGKYARLSVEFGRIDAVMKDTGETVSVSLPKNRYVFVTAVPVDYGATSAVGLILDLNRSFARKDGACIFTPHVDVRSYHGVNYMVRDDGHLEFYTGEMGLSELARFNETGGSEWSVTGGAYGSCVENCTRSDNSVDCMSPGKPTCHARCASLCLGEPAPSFGNMCDDGTPVGKCSSNKPFFCTASKQYLADCAICGCPDDQICRSDGGCEIPR